MLDNKAFGALIASRRREIGLTQDAFAAMLGITPQAISKWENGVGYPDVTLFPDIARSLDVSLETLFGTQPAASPASTTEDASVDAARPPLLSLSPDIPQSYCSLPPVAAGEHYVCFSDKSLADPPVDTELVRFADGSCADLESGEVENYGTGEIRMLPVESVSQSDAIVDSAPQLRKESFTHFHSIHLLCRGSGEVIIKTSPDGQGHIETSGPADFVRSVCASVKDETLSWIWHPWRRKTATTRTASKSSYGCPLPRAVS